jgi:Trypsin-co-occurring domain 1
MKRLLEVPLEDDSSILVEVDDASDRVATRSLRRPGEEVVATVKSLDGAMAPLEPASKAIVERLRNFPDPPNEITVEFGVKLNAEAGVIIARTSGEANFRIVLTWNKKT